MLGLGLASIYVVPALTLQHWISTDILWARSIVPAVGFSWCLNAGLTLPSCG
jgi:hypothetical protein